jgi:hypothetical protein
VNWTDRNLPEIQRLNPNSSFFEKCSHPKQIMSEDSSEVRERMTRRPRSGKYPDNFF